MRRVLRAVAIGAVAVGLLGACSANDGGEQAVVTVTSTTTAAADPAGAPAEAPEAPPAVTPADGGSGGAAGQPADEPCSGLTGTQAVQKWIGHVPTFNDLPWSAEYAEVDGYDPCLPLSWITLPIEGGTASSPYQIMLFNKGRYLGTTTAEAQGFAPIVDRLSDSALQVTYRFPWPGESNAESSGRAVSQFTWDPQQNKVVHTGDLPEDVGGR